MYDDQTEVGSLQFSTLPERTHVRVSLGDSKEEAMRIGGWGVSLDIYTLSEAPEGGRITVSARSQHGKMGYDGNFLVLDRARIADLIEVGMTTLFQQERFWRTLSPFMREMYVSRISFCPPSPEPVEIDLFEQPAGTLVEYRSASLETGVVITGAEPITHGGKTLLPAFSSRFPSSNGADIEAVLLERYLTEGKPFGRVSKVLKAQVTLPSQG